MSRSKRAARVHLTAGLGVMTECGRPTSAAEVRATTRDPAAVTCRNCADRTRSATYGPLARHEAAS